MVGLNQEKKEMQNREPIKMPTEMDCPRCQGMMVQSSFFDLQDDMGQHEFWALRCVQCGNIVDPIIMKNRREIVGAGR